MVSQDSQEERDLKVNEEYRVWLVFLETLELADLRASRDQTDVQAYRELKAIVERLASLRQEVQDDLVTLVLEVFKAHKVLQAQASLTNAT